MGIVKRCVASRCRQSRQRTHHANSSLSRGTARKRERTLTQIHEHRLLLVESRVVADHLDRCRREIVARVPLSLALEERRSVGPAVAEGTVGLQNSSEASAVAVHSGADSIVDAGWHSQIGHSGTLWSQRQRSDSC